MVQRKSPLPHAYACQSKMASQIGAPDEIQPLISPKPEHVKPLIFTENYNKYV